MEIVAKAPLVIASTVLGQIAWSKSDMSMMEIVAKAPLVIASTV